MNALRIPNPVAMIVISAVLAVGSSASAARADLRCDARALQVEAKVLRCLGSCRALAERRDVFNEERCLSRCESNYDEAFAKLLCPADRRLVRAMDAAGATELRCEARVLQSLSRTLRCSARCEDSLAPQPCVDVCDAKYAGAITGGECGE